MPGFYRDRGAAVGRVRRCRAAAGSFDSVVDEVDDDASQLFDVDAYERQALVKATLDRMLWNRPL